MVYFNPFALEDYSNILYGLLTWPKHPLEPEHAKQYMDDIEKVCRSLDNISFHRRTIYNVHKRYGDFVYNYRRNKNTCWYIIYNMDMFYNVYIEKIMNNYITL